MIPQTTTSPNSFEAPGLLSNGADGEASFAATLRPANVPRHRWSRTMGRSIFPHWSGSVGQQSKMHNPALGRAMSKPSLNFWPEITMAIGAAIIAIGLLL